MTQVQELVLKTIQRHSKTGKHLHVDLAAHDIGIPPLELRQHLNQFVLFGTLRLGPGVQEIGPADNILWFAPQQFRTGILHPDPQSCEFDRHALEYIDLFGERWTGEIRELPEGAYIAEVTCHNDEVDRASMVFNSATSQVNLLTAESWWWVRRWAQGAPWDHDGWFRLNRVRIARFELVTDPADETKHLLQVQAEGDDAPVQHPLLLLDHLRNNLDHRRAVIVNKFAQIVARLILDGNHPANLSLALMSGVVLAEFEEDDTDWTWSQTWHNESGVQVELTDPLPDGLSRFAITATENDVECLTEWIGAVYELARNWSGQIAKSLEKRGMGTSRFENLEPLDVPTIEAEYPVLPGIDESAEAPAPPAPEAPSIDWGVAHKMQLTAYDPELIVHYVHRQKGEKVDGLRITSTEGEVLFENIYTGINKLPTAQKFLDFVTDLIRSLDLPDNSATKEPGE